MNWLIKLIIKYDIDPANVYLIGMIIALIPTIIMVGISP